jgi:hypothetical protein
MKTKAKRTIRPSGVEQTNSLFYWKCTVSGLETFGDAKRFADVVKSFGTEENLVKTFVLRASKKYIEAGYTSEQVKAIVEKNLGKLPSLDSKSEEPSNDSIGPKDEVTARFCKAVLVTPEDSKPIEPVKVKAPIVYEWQGNPDFFKSVAVPVNIEEASKDVCFFPNFNIGYQCRECTIYDKCVCPAKYSPEDQLKPNRNEVKIKVVIADPA